MSGDLKSRADALIQKADPPDRQSDFQIEKFIVGKEPTAQSQLWAIVHELSARNESLTAIDRDLQQAEDDLELLDIQIQAEDRRLRATAQEANVPNGDLILRQAELNIRKLQRQKDALVDSARKLRRKQGFMKQEMETLLRMHDEIVKVAGPMKPMDDPEAQAEMWHEKFLEEFNIRLLLGRPLEPDFVRSVMALDEKAPVRMQMTKLIGNIQAKLAAENRKPLHITEKNG